VEADQFDLEAREGWFVLARGAAHHLDTEAERASIIDTGLEPWVEKIPCALHSGDSHRSSGATASARHDAARVYAQEQG
jgi:hypothetical protein